MTALDNVVWIGGAQWAGKSTVTTLLASRYPVATYRYDYHDARSHSARARQDPERFPELHRFITDLDAHADSVWVDPSPAAMADRALRIFEEKFVMVLDDLAAMPEGVTVIADGWGLRPHLVARVIDDLERAIFMVPTEEFRQHQIDQLERARALDAPGLTDPRRAQRNRVERDAILLRDVVVEAHRLGLRVLEVDGALEPPVVAAQVEEQFRPFLPRWLY